MGGGDDDWIWNFQHLSQLNHFVPQVDVDSHLYAAYKNFENIVILKTRHVTIYTQLGENGEKHTGCNLCLNLIGWDDDEWDKHSVDYDDCHE